MSNSLQDQLLKAGLVDKKKAKALQKEKKKGSRKLAKGEVAVDETKLAVKQAAQEKAERDRALNLKLAAEAQRKAIQAQIRQLIENHRIRPRNGDISYQFPDGKSIKKIVLDTRLQQQVIAGTVAIVRGDGGYGVVPRVVAEKILARDAGYVLVLNDTQKDATADDDPYADYQIPDDLMW